MARIGLILFVFGVVYFLRPLIFPRGFWKKTGTTQQKLNLENYNRYMKTIGVIFLLVGLVLMIIGKFKI